MIQELLSKVLNMCPQEINVLLSNEEEVKSISGLITDIPTITWVANDAFKANDEEHPRHNSSVCSFQANGIQFNFMSASGHWDDGIIIGVREQGTTVTYDPSKSQVMMEDWLSKNDIEDK